MLKGYFATLGAALTASLLFSSPSVAALLGPTPYLSAADSPFNGTAFSYFYLEDFEDGALNTPGLSISAGTVTTPGAFVDSVDADDGVIDGSGTAGHSWYSGNTAASITLRFSAAALGALPTHVGVVWTDVGITTGALGVGSFMFEAFDAANVTLGVIGPVQLGDGAATGATAEDRFFGVIHAGGIASVRLSALDSVDWELDHVQYGLAPVPEPASWLLFAAGILLLGITRHVRAQRLARCRTTGINR